MKSTEFFLGTTSPSSFKMALKIFNITIVEKLVRLAYYAVSLVAGEAKKK